MNCFFFWKQNRSWVSFPQLFEYWKIGKIKLLLCQNNTEIKFRHMFFRFFGSSKKTKETILLDILIFDELSQLTWAHLQLLPRIFHCICMLMYSFNLHLVSAEYISTQLLWNRNTLSIFLIEYSSRTIWCSLFCGSIFTKHLRKSILRN